MKKTAVALLINDIHASKDNIAEFQKNWDEMLSVCERENIKDIVVGGDMFTSRASQTLATLLAVKDALIKATDKEICLTIAEGNHDKSDPEAMEGYNHLFDRCPDVDVVNDYALLEWHGKDVHLLVMSYFPENGSFVQKLEEAVKGVRRDYGVGKKDITLYIHEGVHGALGDFDIPNEVPQEALSGFKSVLCGHYHNRTKIKGTNIEYIGSSRQHNFGEDEEKGYTILYDDGSYSFVKNKANIRYKTIEVDAKEIDGFQLEKDPRYKYKVKVKCDEKQAKAIDKQKLMELGFHKVELVAQNPVAGEVTASDINEKYDKQGIKKEYQHYCDDNSINSELGMKYLEG